MEALKNLLAPPFNYKIRGFENLIKPSFNLKEFNITEGIKNEIYHGDFEKLISINPEWLRYFYVLCQSSSFADASALLNITPQALSKAVTGIESQLGIQLIYRTRTFKGLTENGKIFFEKIKVIIGNILEIHKTFINDLTGPLGSIKAGWSSCAGEKVLTPSIIKFMINYPNVNIKAGYLSSNEIFRQLSENKIDIGIFTQKISSDNFHCISEIKLKYVIAGKPQPKKDWDQFSYINQCVSWDQSDSLPAEIWPEKDFKRSVISECSSLKVMLEMCKKGLGVCVLPEMLISKELKEGQLAVVSDIPFPYKSSLYITGKNNIYNNSALATFIKQLQENIINF
jgi:DNA-binding transcriptional LysR family regulator